MLSAWWSQITQDSGHFPVIVAVIAAASALSGAVISALVSYLVTRRAVYINAVTAERSKWIEALRGTISKFSGAAGRINARRNSRENNTKYLDSQDWASDSETLQTLLSDLTLRLNPTEPEARSLLIAAKKLDQAARIHSSPAVILANEVMIRHAQWVLKAEWERVKQEASGFVYAPYYRWRNRLRGKAYANFLSERRFPR